MTTPNVPGYGEPSPTAGGQQSVKAINYGTQATPGDVPMAVDAGGRQLVVSTPPISGAVSAISNAGASTSVTAPGVAGQRFYVTGFEVTSTPATLAASALVTLNVGGNMLSYIICATTTQGGVLIVPFISPLPTPVGAGVTLTVASMAGASIAAVLHGYNAT